MATYPPPFLLLSFPAHHRKKKFRLFFSLRVSTPVHSSSIWYQSVGTGGSTSQSERIVFLNRGEKGDGEGGKACGCGREQGHGVPIGGALAVQCCCLGIDAEDGWVDRLPARPSRLHERSHAVPPIDCSSPHSTSWFKNAVDKIQWDQPDQIFLKMALFIKICTVH
jgi:hypothetical protein